jgi:hypothetical protein
VAGREAGVYITFPALLVLFDDKNDHGYYKWIKRPVEDGQLAYSASGNGEEELNDQSLDRIVTEVKEWYSKKQVE